MLVLVTKVLIIAFTIAQIEHSSMRYMIDGSISEGVSWVLKKLNHARKIHMLSRILCLVIFQLFMNEKKK